MINLSIANCSDGRTIINVNNTKKTRRCPDCGGNGGHREWECDKWHVCNKSCGRIGKIIVEIYDGKEEYKYMLDSTGVGSGTLWSEDVLFLNEIDAQIECNKRNE